MFTGKVQDICSNNEQEWQASEAGSGHPEGQAAFEEQGTE